MPVWLRIVAVAGSVLIAGCSQKASKIEIAGDVTFQGKPVANGMITFLDATAANASAAPHDGHDRQRPFRGGGGAGRESHIHRGV